VSVLFFLILKKSNRNLERIFYNAWGTSDKFNNFKDYWLEKKVPFYIIMEMQSLTLNEESQLVRNLSKCDRGKISVNRGNIR